MASDPTTDSGAPEDDRLIRASVTWPTPRQLTGQLGAVAVTLVLWGGLFWGAMNLPTSADVDMASGASARREARRQQADTTMVQTAGATESVAETQAAPSSGQETRQANTAATPQPPGPKASTNASTSSAPAQHSGTTEIQATPTKTVSATGPDARAVPKVTSTPPPAPTPTEPEDDPLAEPMADAASLGEVSFAADVMPVLDRRCVKCHGGERDEGGQRIEEGLSLRSWEDIMAGSTWGSVVEPGDVAGSYLLELIQNGDMPDKEPRLLPREVRAITQWIATGAKKN